HSIKAIVLFGSKYNSYREIADDENSHCSCRRENECFGVGNVNEHSKINEKECSQHKGELLQERHLFFSNRLVAQMLEDALVKKVEVSKGEPEREDSKGPIETRDIDKSIGEKSPSFASKSFM